MAKLGRWLCSLGILQNNFEIFGIFARFLSARGYGRAVLQAQVGSVAWLCEESGALGCVFLACRLNGGIIFYDCVAGRVLRVTEILWA